MTLRYCSGLFVFVGYIGVLIIGGGGNLIREFRNGIKILIKSHTNGSFSHSYFKLDYLWKKAILRTVKPLYSQVTERLAS